MKGARGQPSRWPLLHVSKFLGDDRCTYVPFSVGLHREYCQPDQFRNDFNVKTRRDTIERTVFLRCLAKSRMC